MRIHRRKFFRPLLAVASLFSVFIITGMVISNVYASDASGIVKKWTWAHYYECLKTGGWYSSIDSNKDINDKIIKRIFKKGDGTYYLPSYQYGHTSSKESLSCYDAIVGSDGWMGPLQSQKDITFATPSSAETLMKNLGYIPEDTGEKHLTIHAHYRAHTSTDKTIGLGNQHTETDTEGDKSSIVITAKPNEDKTSTYYSYNGWDNYWDTFGLSLDKKDGNLYLTIGIDPHVFSMYDGCSSADENQKVSALLYADVEKSRQSIEDSLRNKTWTTNCFSSSAEGDVYSTTTTDYFFSIDNQIVDMGITGIYKYQYESDRYTGADVASKNFGGENLSKLAPTATERYNMFLYYLQKVLPANVQNRLTTTPTDKTNLVKIRLKATDGTFKDFYANFNTVTPSAVTVYDLQDYYFNDDNTKHFPKVVATTMQKVIDFFNTVSESSLTDDVDLTEEDGGVDPTQPITPGDTEDDGSSTDRLEEECYKNAKSLGWVICPVIFGLREVTGWLYEYIEPLIRVDDTIVAQLGQQDSTLFKGWNTFRGLANIIFVIIFMLIIFSQLTGVGIDNYGIKKMLPKLIITAILVNISFIIVAIAVDISNIVGHSIESLFENLGGTITMMDVSGASSGTVSGTVAITTAPAVQKHTSDEVVSWLVIAAGAGGVGYLISGWAIIIPILLFLLTTIISVIFAMIILGLRQAIVIILIVLAPIAFACTVLPNTESIFKKWFNAFKGILIVYPVIGGLIGAGYFTASLIYTGNKDSGTDLIMTIVAGILSVVPYFLIPSLTRKSLDGIGMLGSKISGFGKSLGTGMKRGINNSDYVHNAKADSKAGVRRIGAGLYMNTLGKKTAADIASGKKVSVRRANKFARNASLANTREQANISARTADSQYGRLQGDGYKAAMSAAGRAEDDMAVKNYETLVENSDYKYGGMTEGVNYQDTAAIGKALEYELSQEEGKVDTNKIRALQNILNRKGDKGRNAIFSAMAGAQASGNVSSTAVKAFSSNIMNNQGDYKAAHRSLYEYAKDTAVSGVGDINGYSAAGAMALTQNSFLGTDKTQMDEYVRAYNDPNSGMTTEERKHFEQLAHGIAGNTNVHDSIRVDDYGEALKTFAPDVNWDQVFSGKGLKIDHNAALSVFKDRLNHKVSSGVYTQEQADQLMAKARTHIQNKNNKA